MPIINYKQQQQGFTMIEVLIAAFVLGIGLLGLASLQARSLQFNYSAYQRSQANLLAYDIIDRMRANPATVVRTANYNIGLGAGPVSNTNCQSAGAGCTSGDMANFDLSQWKCSLGNWNNDAICQGFTLEGPLAEGDGAVQVVSDGEDAAITVTISWVDDRTLDVGNANRRETFTVNTVLSVKRDIVTP